MSKKAHKDSLLFPAEEAFIYKKKRRDYVPVTDTAANVEAKEILDGLYEKAENLNISEQVLQDWDNVALFSSNGNPEKASALYLRNEDTTYSLKNTLNNLTAKEWLTETVTVFTQKGLGAGNAHAQIEKQHPAPFSFQDVARLIRFFTKQGEKVLDPFSGVASTAKACAFESRIGYGIELNHKYHELGAERLSVEIPEEAEYKTKQHLIHGNSIEKIKDFDDGFFDFIVTSPPYWNILETIDHKANEHRVNNGLDVKYSDSKADLANIEDYDEFLKVLSSFFNDCGRILSSKKYMAIIVSDFRKKDDYYLFHADLAKMIESFGVFKLKGIRILHQKFKSIYPYGYPFSFVPNIHHQNVLIFQKKV